MEMFAPFKKLIVAAGMSASDKKNRRAVVCKSLILTGGASNILIHVFPRWVVQVNPNSIKSIKH